MTDQKKTLPFHITIKHGEEVLTDIDTDGIIAVVCTENEDEVGGTAVHLLTECTSIRLIGLLKGATSAIEKGKASLIHGLDGILSDSLANARKKD